MSRRAILPAWVQGKTLAFRGVSVDAAAFILSLRTDAEKSRYLRTVSGQLSEQQAWLERYARADDQAYFRSGRMHLASSSQ